MVNVAAGCEGDELEPAAHVLRDRSDGYGVGDRNILDERPLAGVEALRSLATWAGATVDRLSISLGATAPGTITKGPGRQPPDRALGL